MTPAASPLPYYRSIGRLFEAVASTACVLVVKPQLPWAYIEQPQLLGTWLNINIIMRLSSCEYFVHVCIHMYQNGNFVTSTFPKIVYRQGLNFPAIRACYVGNLHMLFFVAVLAKYKKEGEVRERVKSSGSTLSLLLPLLCTLSPFHSPLI